MSAGRSSSRNSSRSRIRVRKPLWGRACCAVRPCPQWKWVIHINTNTHTNTHTLANVSHIPYKNTNLLGKVPSWATSWATPNAPPPPHPRSLAFPLASAFHPPNRSAPPFSSLYQQVLFIAVALPWQPSTVCSPRRAACLTTFLMARSLAACGGPAGAALPANAPVLKLWGRAMM